MSRAGYGEICCQAKDCRTAVLVKRFEKAGEKNRGIIREKNREKNREKTAAERLFLTREEVWIFQRYQGCHHGVFVKFLSA